MNLKRLSDQELLHSTKNLVSDERKVLTQILHHLREVERRKLFSDLGHQSLFEYAVKELKYSEGQAGRRIQAMRLIKEIPQVEEKIATGTLSLSNVSQAQSFFRQANKTKPQEKIKLSEKLEVLKSLENKSAREGQKVLIKRQPEIALPKDRERILTENHTEMKFVMTEDLKSKLEEVKSLLGPKAYGMGFSELVACLAEMGIEKLKEKKFGKKRVAPERQVKVGRDQQKEQDPGRERTPTSDGQRVVNSALTPRQPHRQPTRYISKATQYRVWRRAQGRCQICSGKTNLQVDHCIPLALGGSSELENLRLLCFHCNQRQAVKNLGLARMERARSFR